jgi:hypothetical protein
MMCLTRIVQERSFPEFAQWWGMGNEFSMFMSRAIVSQWLELNDPKMDFDQVHYHVTEYLQLVYGHNVDIDLLENFIQQDFSHVLYSGEFDALSYAFYRSAFEALAEKFKGDVSTLVRERKRFTNQVGKIFFTSIRDHLQLNLPSDLRTPTQLTHLQNNIDLIGKFLLDQGYLRDQCEFTFCVDVIHAGKHILQETDDFLQNLHQNNAGYALYKMGYPVILPSAVYLFKMFGEAQHHSSRTIEELFERIGYKARETDDFDPSNFPPDRVVELWTVSS